MAKSGTTNPIKIVVLSATNPIMGGSMAPPTIAVTINPESSLDRSGILSTVIEKIKGNIFANPKPVNTIPMNVRNSIPENKNNRPIIEMMTDITKNFFGARILKIIPPVNLPIRIGKKNNAQVIHKPNFTIPNFSFIKMGTPELMETSAPTYTNIASTIIG